MTWRPLATPRAEREPQPLRASLDRIAASIGAPAPGLLATVFTRWAAIVGPDVAAHATPTSLRDGVLTVSVDHPAWATSLRLLSADLLARIAAAGEGDVRELVAQVHNGGRRPSSAGVANRRGVAGTSRRHPPDPGPAEAAGRHR